MMYYKKLIQREWQPDFVKPESVEYSAHMVPITSGPVTVTISCNNLELLFTDLLMPGPEQSWVCLFMLQTMIHVVVSQSRMLHK